MAAMVRVSSRVTTAPPVPQPPAGFPFAAAPPAGTARWSASAWLFLRRGSAPQLAAGGTLGGSQVGGRLSYRLNEDPERPLALLARIYAPLGADGAEAALGIEWKPWRALPVRLLAERRQAIGDDGRSAVSLLGYGGVSDRKIAGRLLLDAYAQAGVVGLRARDLFADGSAQIGLAIDRGARLKAGAGLWGAAQPGVARLDAGPQLSWRLPVKGANLRLAADWRFRIAGDAAPRSGPALTLATDF
jgi:hypothetical protein